MVKKNTAIYIPTYSQYLHNLSYHRALYFKSTYFFIHSFLTWKLIKAHAWSSFTSKHIRLIPFEHHNNSFRILLLRSTILKWRNVYCDRQTDRSKRAFLHAHFSNLCSAFSKVFVARTPRLQPDGIVFTVFLCMHLCKKFVMIILGIYLLS